MTWLDPHLKLLYGVEACDLSNGFLWHTRDHEDVRERLPSAGAVSAPASDGSQASLLQQPPTQYKEKLRDGTSRSATFVKEKEADHKIADEYRRRLPPETPMNVMFGELCAAVSERNRALQGAAVEAASDTPGNTTYPIRKGVDYQSMADQQDEALKRLTALRSIYHAEAHCLPIDLRIYPMAHISWKMLR